MPAMMKPDTIKIPLSDGKKLVAEKNLDSDYKEIAIFLEDENGQWIQDLAIIGEDYFYDNNLNVKPNPGVYSIKAYLDPNTEDYTDEFYVAAHDEKEEK